MLKTLRRKFVVTAMAAVTALFLVLLGGINGVNVFLSSRNTDMLLLALTEGEGTIRPGREAPGLFRPPLDADAALSAVYFTVRLDGTGEAVGADISRISSVTEAEAEQYAEKAAASGERAGREERFKYRIARTRDGAIAVFLDVSDERRAILTVAALSLLAGAGCWLAALLAVMLLSRRATRPIAESMARQKQFITDAGHEIKTPLAIIRANADALELHQGESRWSRNIRGQTERLDLLTKRLLALARLDEGGPVPEETELDLSALTEAAAAQFTEPAEAAGLSLTADIAPDLRLRGTPEAVTELVGILLYNAVKYSEPGSAVALRLSREGAHILLSVRNRSAVPVAEPERLFGRFYRGDAARTQSGGGTGLGLAIARALAESMGGTLTAAVSGGCDMEFMARF
ncbi:MAG: sensor histidine kinase [Candidatus Scatomorpha sp.]|jgi:two-component system sensor histidine kinase CiaH